MSDDYLRQLAEHNFAIIRGGVASAEVKALQKAMDIRPFDPLELMAYLVKASYEIDADVVEVMWAVMMWDRIKDDLPS